MNLIHPLLVLLASLTQQELARQVVFLREENRNLRSRFTKRVKVSPTEKSRLIKLGRDLGVKLRELISIVSYSTFLRWIGGAGRHHGYFDVGLAENLIEGEWVFHVVISQQDRQREIGEFGMLLETFGLLCAPACIRLAC